MDKVRIMLDIHFGSLLNNLLVNPQQIQINLSKPKIKNNNEEQEIEKFFKNQIKDIFEQNETTENQDIEHLIVNFAPSFIQYQAVILKIILEQYMDKVEIVCFYFNDLKLKGKVNKWQLFDPKEVFSIGSKLKCIGEIQLYYYGQIQDKYDIKQVQNLMSHIMQESRNTQSPVKAIQFSNQQKNLAFFTDKEQYKKCQTVQMILNLLNQNRQIEKIGILDNQEYQFQQIFCNLKWEQFENIQDLGFRLYNEGALFQVTEQEVQNGFEKITKYCPNLKKLRLEQFCFNNMNILHSISYLIPKLSEIRVRDITYGIEFIEQLKIQDIEKNDHMSLQEIICLKGSKNLQFIFMAVNNYLMGKKIMKLVQNFKNQPILKNVKKLIIQFNPDVRQKELFKFDFNLFFKFIQTELREIKQITLYLQEIHEMYRQNMILNERNIDNLDKDEKNRLQTSLIKQEQIDMVTAITNLVKSNNTLDKIEVDLCLQNLGMDFRDNAQFLVDYATATLQNPFRFDFDTPNDPLLEEFYRLYCDISQSHLLMIYNIFKLSRKDVQILKSKTFKRTQSMIDTQTYIKQQLKEYEDEDEEEQEADEEDEEEDDEDGEDEDEEDENVDQEEDEDQVHEGDEQLDEEGEEMWDEENNKLDNQ